MSYYDYKVGRTIAAADTSFAALIQAAMRRADTVNLALLRQCWPDIWDELYARYGQPGGYLDGENIPESGRPVR